MHLYAYIFPYSLGLLNKLKLNNIYMYRQHKLTPTYLAIVKQQKFFHIFIYMCVCVFDKYIYVYICVCVCVCWWV